MLHLGMGLKSFFSKISSRFKQVFGVIADIGRLPFLPTVIAHIPVVGPWLHLAITRVVQAEDLFKNESKSGEQKRAWAVERLLVDFKLEEVDSKRILAAIELALLLVKNEAFVTEDNGPG